MEDAPTELVLSDRTIDLDTGRVSTGGALRRLELRLLLRLVRSLGVSVPVQALLEEVFHYGPTVRTHTLHTTVYRLRAAIEVDPRRPRHLIRVGNDGYLLDGKLGVPAPVPVVPLAALPPTDLVGRTAELARVLDQLGAHRWVTLTGTGGVGKTRLATEVVARWQDRGAAAWFCDLSGCRNGDELDQAVARTLGIQIGPMTDLGEALDSRDGDLFVLDNAEHLLGELRVAIEGWVRRPHGARLLVTSRERAGGSAEQVVELAPLPLAEGVALFRRRVAQLGVVVDADDPAVEALVAHLDALPLAIELAAARTEVFAPAELLARLDRGSSAALGKDPARGPRHSSLDAMVRWSWDLLSPSDRRALVACTVFVGDFTIDDAEAVAAGPGDDVLDALHALRRRGLVRQTPVRTGSRRFALYQAVRAFVAAQADPVQLTNARDRHARWYARWGDDDMETVLLGRDRTTRFARLSDDLPDLLQAIEHAIGREPDLAAAAFVGAAAALGHRGPVDQIEALARQVLPQASSGWAIRIHHARLIRGEPPREAIEEIDAALAHAPSRYRAGGIRTAYVLGDPDRARTIASELLPELRAAGHAAGLIHALYALSTVEGVTRGWHFAEPAIREYLAFSQRMGFPAAEMRARIAASEAARHRGDRDHALGEAQHAHLLAVALDPFSLLLAVNQLAIVHMARAEPGLALIRIDETVELARQLGNVRGLATSYLNLGNHHAIHTDTALAEGWYEQALPLAREHGLDSLAAAVVGELGNLAFCEGRLADAVVLLTQALAMNPEGARHTSSLGQRGGARVTLGDRGGLEDLDQAVEFALRLRSPRLQRLVYGQRAVARVRMGDPGGAQDLERSLAVAEITGQTELAEVQLLRCEFAWVLGDPDAATTWADEVELELERLSLPPEGVLGRCLATLRRTFAGDPAM